MADVRVTPTVLLFRCVVNNAIVILNKSNFMNKTIILLRLLLLFKDRRNLFIRAVSVCIFLPCTAYIVRFYYISHLAQPWEMYCDDGRLCVCLSACM